jgi:hypothetical protein
MFMPRLNYTSLAKAANAPVVVGGLLAMIVGYHFWGAPGFWVVFAGFCGINLLIGSLQRAGEDRQHIREMHDRDELR